MKGSDDYRNERLKMIPALVDGPMAVRILAPPKKECLIHGSVVPLSWYKHDVETCPTTNGGKTLCPVVVVAIDCVSSRAIRSMAGIIKKYMVRLTCDVALVVGPPEDIARRGQAEHDDEPQACLGLFRFEHIDIESCPEFPILVKQGDQNKEEGEEEEGEEEQTEEERRDIELACRLSGISKEDVKLLMEEELSPSQ